MKNMICAMLLVMLGCGTVLAEGGKNQGETGSGNTTTGSDAQGSAQQDRTGR